MSDIQKTILTVYALIFAGSLLMMVPVGVIPFAGMSCLIVGLISAYIYRNRADDDLMNGHMSYVIRTIWWSSLVLLVGVLLFCSIVGANGDLSMIHDLMEQAEIGLIPTETDVRLMQHQFLNANTKIIGLAALFGLLPYPLYLIYRLVGGIRKAIKGDPPA